MRFGLFIFVAGLLALLTSCQYVGPIAIDQGRDRYNNIIQATSKEQTLSNIIRVSNHDPISVMDVTEVDAAQSFVAGATSGLTNIGAKRGTTGATLTAALGSASANAQYSETPTIRYQPLLGQALIAQLVTPVSVEALGLLNDSSWKVTPLLDFAASYLTLDYHEFYVALNIVSELYTDGALELVAAKSGLTKAPTPAKSEPKAPAAPGTLTLEVATKPESAGPSDSLDIYLQPFHPHEPRNELAERRRQLQLWTRLLWLYYGTQPAFTPQNPVRCGQIGLTISVRDLRAWDMNLRSNRRTYNLDEIRQCLPNFIELRTAPVPPEQARNDNLVSGAPMMRTYSALGILKNATERPHPKIAFVTRDFFNRIRSYPWNQDVDNASFYTLLPETEDPLDNPIAPTDLKNLRIDQEVTNWIQTPANDLFVYEPLGPISEIDYIEGNRRLGLLRRYILIVVDDAPPPVAPYASHFANGKWYYIDGDDEISQKNFNLIALFLTMMAIPSALPPLSPVINVGGN